MGFFSIQAQEVVSGLHPGSIVQLWWLLGGILALVSHTLIKPIFQNGHATTGTLQRCHFPRSVEPSQRFLWFSQSCDA